MAVSSWRELFSSVRKRAQPLSYVISVIGDYHTLYEGSGDDVKSAWPSDALGHTHVIMLLTMRCQIVRWS